MATNLRPSIRSLITVAAMTLGAASAVYADLASPTFSADVAPLMSRYCASCHQPDGAAPFSLLTHASVRQHATQIVAALASGYMPPWKSEPGYGEFVGQPRPTAAEVDLINRWVAAGAPEGDRSSPIVPAGNGGWRLGTPDAIIRPPAPYVLPAEGQDVFRILVVPLGGDRARYVRGLEFQPGNAGVVHHANLRIDATAASRDRDAEDPEPGYDGLLARSARFPDGHFLGWTPGQAAPLLPPGLAWRLEPGSDIVIQIHMQPSGKAETVWPSIALYFTDEPPRLHPVMLRLSRQDIDIPANTRAHEVTDSYTLPVDIEVLAVQPHAHYRATTVRGRAVLPDGSSRWLIVINRWDFRWQHLYRYEAPLKLPAGTRLIMEYVYDNSDANPRNPVHPAARAVWGQRTNEEMGDLWIQALAANEPDRRRLNESFRAKAVADDLAGYENLLRRTPDDAGMHDDAAVLYLEIGRFTEAAAHFGTVASLRPRSASAFFNLGTALLLQRALDEARRAFEQALALDAAYLRARQQLTRVLVRLGDGPGAETQARLLLASAPADADAHHQLALALRLQGRQDQSMAALRAAVRAAPDAVPPLLDLAWLLATAPPPASERGEAVALAERAVALTRRQDAVALDTLGVAHASIGRFDRAIEAAEAALALVPPGTFADDIRRRLGGYREGRAYSR